MSELGLAAQPQDPRHLALRAVLDYTLDDFDAGAKQLSLSPRTWRCVPSSSGRGLSLLYRASDSRRARPLFGDSEALPGVEGSKVLRFSSIRKNLKSDVRTLV